VTADYVLPVLAVAFCTADEAGIECRTIANGFLDDHEADSLAIGIQREEMQIPSCTSATGTFTMPFTASTALDCGGVEFTLA